MSGDPLEILLMTSEEEMKKLGRGRSKCDGCGYSAPNPFIRVDGEWYRDEGGGQGAVPLSGWCCPRCGSKDLRVVPE